LPALRFTELDLEEIRDDKKKDMHESIVVQNTRPFSHRLLTIKPINQRKKGKCPNVLEAQQRFPMPLSVHHMFPKMDTSEGSKMLFSALRVYEFDDYNTVVEEANKMQSSENKMQSSENKMQSSENKMQCSENKMQSSENKMQSSENKMQSSENAKLDCVF